MSHKRVEEFIIGRHASDGAGVKLKRIISGEHHARLDPWLMLDEFGSDKAGDYIAGFPPHPHRGFETITYMLAGRMEHQDNHGNRGVVETGGVQWMRAARGIIHSEMPAQEAGLMRGFQFWLNLAAADKMSDPDWADVPSSDIPVVQAEGFSVKVVAGDYAGAQGAIQRHNTQPYILDVRVETGLEQAFAILAGHSSFVYVYEGRAVVADNSVEQGKLAVLSQEGEQVMIQADAGTRLLLVSAMPLHEPIAANGPFVMNTQAELRQAFVDYREGRF